VGPVVENNPYRLPRNVVPERYDLELTPDIAAATFAGTAAVRVQVVEATEVIKLNATELQISEARLSNADGSQLSLAIALDDEAEVATLSCDELVGVGEWTLELAFTGILNDKLHGFYRSSFTDDDGKEHAIATTQFEATDARRAFPCWDEPDFKAIFGVTLVVDAGLTALSNADVTADTVLADGLRRVEFADTMKMSTYLVAFIVGEFVVSEPVDVDGVPLRVAAVPGREALTPFALEAGAAALRYLTGYFGIAYPGDKLDLIAIPDFAFGAMENLGCVTFRETALLVDPARASRLEIARVADVIGHEIAHMWFGDLVTMKWWNGIWLNEAFATFMQISFSDHFRPAWQAWTGFGVSKSAAMAIDSLSSTRPIEFEVISPAEAQGMFDLLTYQKGGSVLRMLEQYLGAETFAAGISAYLRKHAYANAETSDLWDALELASDEPVRAVMDSWILQPGHPIVHVTRSSDRSRLTLTQKRFRYLDTEPNDVRWQIPIGIRVGENGTSSITRVLLTEESATIDVPAGADWLLVNSGSDGFFRVAYDTELLADISSHVDELAALERFTLATDAWALCLAGDIGLSDVLTVVQGMRHDDDPDVWSALLAPLRVLDKVVPAASRAGYQSYLRTLLSAKFAELGWEPTADEDQRTRSLRGVLIAALGGLGNDGDVQREAGLRYAAYQSDPTSLDANLVVPVEGVLAAAGLPEAYDELYAKFAGETSTPQEKVNALEALASFADPVLTERTLGLISSGAVRSQDAPYTIRVMLSQRDVGPRVWDWCVSNWDDLMRRLPNNSIDRMVQGLTAQVDPELSRRAREFLADHPIPQAQKSVAQTVERLQVNEAFYGAHLSEVAALFD
jgi:puromycin-sensitive aminopeptidase